MDNNSGRKNLPKKARKSKAGQSMSPAKANEPLSDAEWTRGLKQLYDSVVEEPLPDSFHELLAQLDTDD